MIKLIVAVSKNGVIGRDGDLIFKDSQDMEHFKETTSGHRVVMGRKTWESIGSKPLSNRENWVVSKNYEWCEKLIYETDAVFVTTDVDELVKNCVISGDTYIIGGGEIYSQTIDLVDELIISEFHEEVEGDTFFPKIDLDTWEVKEEKSFTNFTLKIYKRK